MALFLDDSGLAEHSQRLIAAAMRAGAEAADAIAVRSVSLGVEVREGAVEESERSEGDDLGLRVFLGRRQAVVSTNDLKMNPSQLAERALAMARVAPDDPFAGLAEEARLARAIPELDLLDPRLPDVAELEQRARRAEAAALVVKGVTKSGGAASAAGISGIVLATSSGFRGSYTSSYHSVSMTAIAGEGTAMERDYDYSTALHAADLEAPEKIGRTAGERSVQRLNPHKIDSKRVPVVFDRRVAGSLVAHLASAINGAAVARRTSFLKDKLGQRLFSKGISVIDDPLRRRGLRSRPFDAEGVASKQLALVEDGILTSWLLDCATARELGFVTTGHAQRGVSSNPAPSPTNLHLTPGASSPESLIEDIEEGFYVTDLIGAGVNMVTGDYSRGASGFWILHGQRSYPVSEVTVAGNLIDIFQNLLPANDLEFRFGSNAPTLRVEGLTVAGR
jgi:PmbA protein